MTALQIAYAECANWRKDGKGCLGAIIDDDLQVRRCDPKPKCVLETPGERCQYFEECVAPMGPGIYNEAYRVAFMAAVRDYRLAAKLPCAEERPRPMCGKAMEPRQRFCFACAAERRRESWRLKARTARGKSSQLSQKQPLTINDLEGGSDLSAVPTLAGDPARHIESYRGGALVRSSGAICRRELVAAWRT
jgi:hypothetical protein